jgi:hypothetical protein
VHRDSLSYELYRSVASPAAFRGARSGRVLHLCPLSPSKIGLLPQQRRYRLHFPAQAVHAASAFEEKYRLAVLVGNISLNVSTPFAVEPPPAQAQGQAQGLTPTSRRPQPTLGEHLVPMTQDRLLKAQSIASLLGHWVASGSLYAPVAKNARAAGSNGGAEAEEDADAPPVQFRTLGSNMTESSNTALRSLTLGLHDLAHATSLSSVASVSGHKRKRGDDGSEDVAAAQVLGRLPSDLASPMHADDASASASESDPYESSSGPSTRASNPSGRSQRACRSAAPVPQTGIWDVLVQPQSGRTSGRRKVARVTRSSRSSYESEDTAPLPRRTKSSSGSSTTLVDEEEADAVDGQAALLALSFS